MVGVDQPLFLADAQGLIKCYQSSKDMESNSYTILRGHNAAVSKLLVTTKQDSLISLSNQDHTLVEWAIDSTDSAKDDLPTSVVTHVQAKGTSLKDPESLVLCGGVTNKRIEAYINSGP